MTCDEAQSLLIDSPESSDPAARRAAMEHLAGCASCRDAEYAVGVLRIERSRPVPPPTPGAFERAVAAATQAAAAGRDDGDARAAQQPAAHAGRRLTGFWAGLGAGVAAAAAAAAVAWVAVLAPSGGFGPAPAETPQVTMALHEPRDVSISVDTPAALSGAEIRVVLSGAISLEGFSDRRELSWRTDLEAGSNRLTLPVVATDVGGGQLVVEVEHGEKRRTFVVDVQGVTA